jgi:hypothetical protein
MTAPAYVARGGLSHLGGDSEGTGVLSAGIVASTLALWVALAILIPLHFTTASDHLHRPEVLVAWLLVCYTAFHVARVVVVGLPRLVDAGFWTFSYAFLCLPAVAQYANNAYPIPSQPFSDGAQLTGDLVIALGIVSYQVGRRASRPLKAAPATNGKRSKLPDPAHAERPAAAFAGFALGRMQVLGVLSLLAVAYGLARYGIRPFFQSRESLSASFLGSAPQGAKFYAIANKASGGLSLLIVQVPVLVAAVLLLYTRRVYGAAISPDERRRLWPPWLLVALVLGNLIVNNPISSSRLWFGTVLLSMTASAVSLDRKKVVRVLLGVLLFLSLFSMDQLDAFRRSGAPNFSSRGLSVQLVSGPDYASPQQVLNGIVYFRNHGYQEGRQLAGALLVDVPRSVWEDKPHDTGDLVANDQNNVAAPLWTEGQVDFGLFGVVAYLLAYGFVGGRLETLYQRRKVAPSVLAALVPVMAGYGLFFLRGSLQPACVRFFPILLLFLLMRRRGAEALPAANRSHGIDRSTGDSVIATRRPGAAGAPVG